MLCVRRGVWYHGYTIQIVMINIGCVLYVVTGGDYYLLIAVCLFFNNAGNIGWGESKCWFRKFKNIKQNQVEYKYNFSFIVSKCDSRQSNSFVVDVKYTERVGSDAASVQSSTVLFRRHTVSPLSGNNRLVLGSWHRAGPRNLSQLFELMHWWMDSINESSGLKSQLLCFYHVTFVPCKCQAS